MVTSLHRDPDIGLLQGCGVVDGVTGHGDDVAAVLHQPGQAHLVLRRDPSEDVDIGQGCGQFRVAHGCQVGSADCSRAQAEVGADCGCGDRVVTGDHPNLDAGLPGHPHRLDGRGSQRVDDPDHADKLKFLDEGHRIRRDRGLVPGEVANGERQDP